MTNITERVILGAEFLDQHDPEWWREGVPNAINPDTLDLGDPASCVLGQRCPLEVLRAYASDMHPRPDNRYWAYADKLTGLNSGEIFEWALGHGFALSHVTGDSLWDELTEAWSDLITKRRKDAADRGELA